jgi:hypothetical protein
MQPQSSLRIIFGGDHSAYLGLGLGLNFNPKPNFLTSFIELKNTDNAK